MKNGKTLKKVFAYIGKYKYVLFTSVLLTVVSSALQLYVPILVGRAIDNIISRGSVAFENVYDKLIKIAVIIACVFVLQWLQNILNNAITFNVVRDLRQKAFEKIQRLPFKYIDSRPNGDIVSRVISDADQLADGLLMGFSQFFTGIATIIGTLFFMLYINAVLALVVVVLTPLSFFIARFIAKKTYNMFKLQSEARGEQTAFIDEMVTNQKVVEAYSHTAENKEKFSKINSNLAKYSLWATFFSSITNPATRFVNAVVYAGVALFGALLAISGSGSITVGILASFLSYANQYTKPFNEISSVITELQNAMACAARLIELIEEEEINENTGEKITPANIKGEIFIDNIDFSYTPERELIKNLTLKVKPGEKVAIVGKTGCGKTTLINLLMKFYDVDSGSISVDSVKYDDINVSSLREAYGMVLQDTWLKSASVYDNIKMGKPGADLNEVKAAAKAAFADSFIKRLPNGYDTVIGADGGTLSQGQKQLICIARLMLVNSSMLILDEATSNIDTRTEIKIQKAFEKLMAGKTTFIVAHRLSTIKNADLIVVMDNGRVVETGNHQELLDKKKFYYKLYNSQFINADNII
ncbi:MAG: ABC transporter ATP-binding protein/permease [Clostridiales bacterium]|nr:ABC transporter ATP-binding protein/permease [Clostridiales bacterium]